MLTDKVALITGAASGIGLAMSQAFREAGCRVVMADVNEEALTREAEKLDALAICADLSLEVECKRLAEVAIEEYGGVDILINVAGIQKVVPIEDFPVDTWDFMIRLMLNAPFYLTKYCWPSMKERGWGRIIHLNSIHGLVASEFKSAYVTAKHGLTGLTKVSALEGGPYGITVNSICPAYVRTPLVDKQIADQAASHGIGEDEVIEKIMLQKASIKKLLEPKTVADVALFLCSDSASQITGITLPIDGGWISA